MLQMSTLPSDLLNQNFWRWGLEVCIINTPLLGDSDSQLWELLDDA